MRKTERDGRMSRVVPAKHARAHGFTLVELMVSLLIGLFLIGAVLTLTFAMKRTNVIQGTNIGLQENQRVALTILNDTIQQAGYYPNPVNNTATSFFPIYSPFTAVGQSIFASGQYVGNLYVRYGSSGNDGVLNCLGGTSSVPVTYIAEFSTDSNQNLLCTLTTITGGAAVTAAPQIIATGVSAFITLYGVHTNPVGVYQSIDSYLAANTVTLNTLWNNVISVQVTLVFANPLYNAGSTPTAGQSASAPQSYVIVRTIALMNTTGVNS
jgi:type IV pilus assembly protein PilW